MSEINPTSSAHRVISVNNEGMFQVKGRAVDMIGLIFEIQNETKAFAQNRLSLTAQELWDTNEESKKLVFLLDRVRALRPTGDADAKVADDKLTELVTDYNDKYGGNPFWDFGVGSLVKPQYILTDDDGKKVDTLNQDDMAKVFGYANYSIVMPEANIGGIYEGKHVMVNLSFDKTKQAEVDQLIEGIKSKISTINSTQELLNNDTQKYTRLSDETKEAMAGIEKAIDNFRTTEESKI